MDDINEYESEYCAETQSVDGGILDKDNKDL